MSRFEQLRGWHTDQRKSILEYWDSLLLTAEVFRQGYAKYLEAPDEGWRDPEGVKRDYVVLANKVGSKYEDVSYNKLSGADSWLDFHIGVVLDQSANQYPKKRIYTHLQMKKEQDAFIVKSDAPTFSAKVSNGPDGPDFDEAYFHLFEAVRDNLSYRP